MYYIGIDLGGTNIAAGVVNESCEIIAKGSVPTGRLRPFAEIMKDMADLCKKLIADAGISESEVKSIGIASPGTPDVENVKVRRNHCGCCSRRKGCCCDYLGNGRWRRHCDRRQDLCRL